MRKITAALFMTVDGVVETPYKWSQPYVTEEMSRGFDAALKGSDAVLLGRRTYEIFSKIWPSQGSEMPMADFLNHTHKYVVSSTLDKLEWGPASLIKGNQLRTEITKLKEAPGKNMQVPGSPTLVKSLLREGLLDQLILGICPIGLGSGQRLFEGTPEPIGLKLVETSSSHTGVVTVTYARADQQSEEAPKGAIPWAPPKSIK
ncbi:MAG: dihydrofolate reductase family protein [Nitrososphaerota archaeon]|nr:dihydrofolate reductase family protein [Nitrososphaerota archaeon]